MMKAFVICCLLVAALTSPAQSIVVRTKRAPGYYGPPAPLRSDGSVAPTPEVAAATAHQHAAHAQELRRLSEAAALASAHPDTTSPGGQSWDSGNSWNSGASHWNAPAPAAPQWNAGASHWNSDDSGQYNPSQNDEGQYNPSWNNPGPSAGQWNGDSSSHWNGNSANQWSGNSYNHGAAQPAPLNHDGTVAPTKEWQAIASAHAAAHQHVPAGHHYGRKRRSAHFYPALSAIHGVNGLGYAAISAPVAAPLAYAPAYHSAAPLKADGTVAETPEVAHVAAAHHAAREHQLSVLAAEAAKTGGAYAGGYDDGSYYGDHNDGSYHGAHDDGSYHGGYNHGSYSGAHDDGSYHGEHNDGSYHGAHDDGSYAGDHDDGSYHGDHDDGSYHGHAAGHAPVTLNHDGTVAHTPEYLAIAAKLAAAHHHY